MKKFMVIIVVLTMILSSLSTQAQKADSLMLKDKAIISEVKTFVINTQKQLQDNPGTSLSREDQLYVLDLFSEMLRITLTFYPEDSLKNSSQGKVIISDDVKKQLEDDIRKQLDEKLKEEK